MRTTPRSTRRATAAHPSVGKENLANLSPATSSKKARHRLSTAELARLDDVFRKETHPSRQQKKDLAIELGMDYKTITIWFQNKRQTSKRGQPPVEKNLGRPRADSCLRAVSSPSLNATLPVGPSGVIDPTANSSESKGPGDGLNTIAAKAIVKIKPLIATLNALTSRPRGHSESTETKCETPNVEDVGPHPPQTLENSIASPAESESDRHDHIAEQEQTKGKPVKWKRIRTLEWACERHAKRRKMSREAYTRSEEVQDHGDSNDIRMDSALSLLSLATSTQVGPPKDVMRGASLLLSFKHSWRRK